MIGVGRHAHAVVAGGDRSGLYHTLSSYPCVNRVLNIMTIKASVKIEQVKGCFSVHKDQSHVVKNSRIAALFARISRILGSKFWLAI